MKFLVANYSCLQNPWLRGYRPQIPVLCLQLNLLNPPPSEKNSWVRHCIKAVTIKVRLKRCSVRWGSIASFSQKTVAAMFAVNVFYPASESSRLLRNVGNELAGYTVSLSRTQQSLSTAGSLCAYSGAASPHTSQRWQSSCRCSTAEPLVSMVNSAPCHEDVWGSGGIAARTFNDGSRWRWVISCSLRPL